MISSGFSDAWIHPKALPMNSACFKNSAACITLFERQSSIQQLSSMLANKYAAPQFTGIYNDTSEFHHELNTHKDFNAQDHAMNQTLIRESRVSLREFVLINLDTPENPEQWYFSSFYFFEPVLVEQPIPPSKTATIGSLKKIVHPFKLYFPTKHLFFSPRVLVVQSRKPYFSVMRIIMEFVYKSIFEPYIKGVSPMKIKPKIINLISKKPNTSILKFKEFIYSTALSIRIPSGPRFTMSCSLKKLEFSIDGFKHEGHLFVTSTVDFILSVLSSNEKLQLLVKVFFHMITEKQILVVCSHPATLYSFLMAVISP